VLDVGCGTGSLAVVAKRRVGATGTVIGVDASPEMIALATRKAARASARVLFQLAAAERLPFPDATFDVVLATLMLHHLPPPLRRECAREALRVLKPGGRMLAVDFATPSTKRKGMLGRLHRHGGVTLEAMVALLRDAGLRVEEMGSVGVSDLQFVLTLAPRLGEDPTPADVVPMTRSLPPLGVSRWIMPMVVIAAVAAHAWMAGRLAGMLSVSAVGIAAGAIALVVAAVHALGVRRRL
jgi:SAM-dependent methyltransferase